MRKTQHEVYCDSCGLWVSDVLFEYVDITTHGILEEISIKCQVCGCDLLRGI